MFIHSFSDAFMYTETVRTIRDGELTEDGHLDFHTAPEL